MPRLLSKNVTFATPTATAAVVKVTSPDTYDATTTIVSVEATTLQPTVVVDSRHHAAVEGGDYPAASSYSAVDDLLAVVNRRLPRERLHGTSVTVMEVDDPGDQSKDGDGDHPPKIKLIIVASIIGVLFLAVLATRVWSWRKKRRESYFGRPDDRRRGYMFHWY